MSAERAKGTKRAEQVEEFFSTLKEMYDKNEEQTSKMWDRVLKTEAYANFQGMSERQIMVVQESMKKNATNALNVAQVPTKDDLANVAKQIIATEEKVDDVIFRMDDLTDIINHDLLTELTDLKKRIADLQKTMSVVKYFVLKNSAEAEAATSADD